MTRRQTSGRSAELSRVVREALEQSDAPRKADLPNDRQAIVAELQSARQTAAKPAPPEVHPVRHRSRLAQYTAAASVVGAIVSSIGVALTVRVITAAKPLRAGVGTTACSVQSCGAPTLMTPSTSSRSPSPSLTPSGTLLVNYYTASPDLTGTWTLDFTPLNFGGTAQGAMHRYTIKLERLDDSKCINTTPCYGGYWWNVAAARYEGFATISVTVSGNTLKLADTEPPDYPYNGSQYYTGTAPNDTTKPMAFSGDWRQYAPNDTTVTPPGDHTRTATFTLTKKPEH